MWSSISGITGKLSNVAATAVQLTRDALEEDNDPMGGSKVGEEGEDLEADLAAYKKLVVDLQLQQVEVSREYQAAFAEKELSLARLRAQVSELGGTVAEEDRGVPPKRQETRKPTATDDDSEFNERLESVVQQWTQRAKGYIGESTKATAELYKRDQLLAKSKKRIEDLEKQLAVQTEIVEHFAQEKTNIHTQAERDEKAMDGLAEEYSLLSARSEAQFERDAKQIAALRSSNEKLMQQVQVLQEKCQFQVKAIDDLTSLNKGTISDGELNLITELRERVKFKDEQVAMLAEKLHELQMVQDEAASEVRNPMAAPRKASDASSTAADGAQERLKQRVQELERNYERDVEEAASHTNEKLEAQVQRLQDEVTKHKEAASSAHAALAAANSAANGDGGGSVDAAAVATAVAAARAQASAEHDAALKKAIAEADAAHAETIDALVASWEARVQAATAEAESRATRQQEAAVAAAVQEAKAAAEASLAREREAHGQALSHLRTTLAADGDAATKAALDAAVAEAMAAARRDAEASLAGAIADADREKAAAVAAAEEQHAAAIAELKAKHEADIASLRADKDAALAAAGSDQESTLARAQAERDEALAAAAATHATAVTTLQEEHAAALAAAAEAAEAAKDEAVAAEREAQRADAAAALADAKAEFEAQASAATAAHAEAMAAAQTKAQEEQAAAVAQAVAAEREEVSAAAKAALDKALEDAAAAAATTQAQAVEDALADANDKHSAALAATTTRLNDEAQRARDELTAELKAAADAALAEAVDAAKAVTQAEADAVLAAKLEEAAKDKADALTSAAAAAADKLAAELEAAAAAAAKSQQEALDAAAAAAAQAQSQALEELAAQKQTELDALQATIDDLHRQMETIEEDLRKRVAQEHAAAIQAERDEADRRVAAKQTEVEEFKQLYAKEARQRKVIHNKLLELQGNIRVFARLRPIMPPERKQGRDVEIASYPLPGEIIIKQDEEGIVTKRFEFDQVFKPDSTQEQVFKDVKPFVTSVLDGYNVCIFAYGQTGSGKTYTMEGPTDNRGVNFRALARLFDGVAKREDEEFELKLSMLEIYNENVYDLLVDPPKRASDRKKLEIRKRSNGGVFVQGLKRVEVASMETVEQVMTAGSKNRAAGSHDMNEHSSRSHLVLAIHVKGVNKISGRVSTAKLNLIDLAGSERISKTSATGDRLKEAQNINKSLSALGDVVAALAKKDKKHVPYRNSKLTFLLQDSLGGNSKVLMFVNASPVIYNVGETMCSLNFAHRCRSVELGSAKKNSESGEVAKLKRQLAALQGGAGAGGAGAGGSRRK